MTLDEEKAVAVLLELGRRDPREMGQNVTCEERVFSTLIKDLPNFHRDLALVPEALNVPGVICPKPSFARSPKVGDEALHRVLVADMRSCRLAHAFASRPVAQSLLR